ncbi:MAG: homoserine dehydrogenase, partial [Thermaerobacterales bacterium]
MRVFRVGLLGLGTVGSGVARLIDSHRSLWRDRHGFEIDLRRVLVRDLHKCRDADVDRNRITADPVSIVEADDIDLVIEAMGGIDPAHAYLSAAMKRGRPVVTANKALLSERWDSLWTTAHQYGVELGIEGAVAAGIPLLRPLAQNLSAVRVTRIEACLNGTCNFVLRRMDGGCDLPAALDEARRLGYAEPDAGDDVSGRDVLRKGKVLSLIVFGRPPVVESVGGIEAVTPERVAALAAAGLRLALVAVLEGPEECPRLTVGLQELPLDQPLVNLTGPENAVLVESAP